MPSVVKAYAKFDHRQRVKFVGKNIRWKQSVAAFAYGTSDQNDFNRSFDHRIDIVVILFKHERCAINAAIGQFKRWRWPL